MTSSGRWAPLPGCTEWGGAVRRYGSGCCWAGARAWGMRGRASTVRHIVEGGCCWLVAGGVGTVAGLAVLAHAACEGRQLARGVGLVFPHTYLPAPAHLLTHPPTHRHPPTRPPAHPPLPASLPAGVQRPEQPGAQVSGGAALPAAAVCARPAGLPHPRLLRGDQHGGRCPQVHPGGQAVVWVFWLDGNADLCTWE
jgi:hypothetical protein